MRRIKRTNTYMRPSLIAMLLLLLFFKAQAADSGGRPGGQCPPNMVWIEAGGFCIDKYEFPNRKGVQPISGIDLSDAIRLCRLQGKRLPTPGEFRLACGGRMKNPYPYGPHYIPHNCRDGLEWYDGPAPAGSYSRCSNEGVYDLTGNVWEWVKRGRLIYVAGGAWNSGADQANCFGALRLNTLVTAPNVGVRCVLYPRKNPGRVR